MKRFRNTVGPLIRKYRSQKGLTQEALAAKLQVAGLDMDRAAVAKVESQIRSVFDYELAVMARVLKVSAEKLFPSDSEIKRQLPNLLVGQK